MSLNEEIAKILQVPIATVDRDPSITNNFIMFNFRPGRPMEDPENYKVNSYNCRSVEFFKNPELLVAGCSQTFGVGAPLEGTWAYFLAKDLGVDYVNTALPGGSTQTIVTNIFAYIRKYGKPKNIVVLLPEVFRITLVSAQGLIHGRYAGKPRGIRYEDFSFRDDINNSDRPKYSKLPHLWEDIVPSQAPVAQSLSALTMLIQYCRDTGINLVWSSWDYDSVQLYSAMANPDNDEDGFYSGYTRMWLQDMSDDTVDCHEDLYEKHGELFHYAWDKAKNYGGHLSVHRHRHVADSFLARFRKEMGNNESTNKAS